MEQSKSTQLCPLRRRYTALEKKQRVKETYLLGRGVSYVARKYDTPRSVLYNLGRVMADSALAGVGREDEVVSKKKVKKLQSRTRELEAALGRKTLDNETLKEAIKIGREKN